MYTPIRHRILSSSFRSFTTQAPSFTFGSASLPEPLNEPVKEYGPGSAERVALEKACHSLRNQTPPEVACIVDGKEIRTGDLKKQLIPSDHKQVLCRFNHASREVLQNAVKGALAAKPAWESLSFEDRASIFLRAATLLSTKYRYEINAATMLGQSKTVQQAEIDSAAELIDFLRFNVKYAEEIYAKQPPKHAMSSWNRSEYRPLEGYVVAISPFNFTAIGGNLCTAPAIMGNVILWKPASTALYSNYVFYKVLLEAGLPPAVILFVPGSCSVFGDSLLNSPDFAGVHFTGSTGVFNSILQTSASNLTAGLYKGYPRMVGETGGKDFHFIHESANLRHAVFNTLRGAFEYQGQKCSACSRAYVPNTIWPKFRDLLLGELSKVKVGQPDDFTSFMSAVIDKSSFENIKGYIEHAKKSDSAEIIYGGKYDDSQGYFVEPTVILAKDPKYKSMQEEIFGPILTIYVYDANKLEDALRLCDETSPYALTGSVFADDRLVIDVVTRALKNAAGNFYINDKCTGAVVGQQPFGGARASGTNDKAGSFLNLLRWVSARTIKENFALIDDWKYPHQKTNN